MNIARHVDRLRYAASSPVKFTLLLHAYCRNRIHGFVRRWESKRVCCILCGWEGSHYDYFLSRELVVKNDMCPNCASLTRNRELADIMAREMKLSGKWLLDIGPCAGYEKWFEKHGAKYFSIDIGPRPAKCWMDITKLALRDGSFDIVICSHVLEHVPNYQTALREIRRVVARDGAAIIDVPFTRAQESVRQEPDALGHVHLFGRNVRELLSSEGFNVEIRNYSADRPQDDPDNQYFIARRAD